MIKPALDHEAIFRRGKGTPPVKASARSIVVMFVIMVAVSGCSRFEFLYAFAGDAIKEQAATYLELD